MLAQAFRSKRLLVLCVAPLIGCGDSPVAPASVASVEITATATTMMVGQTMQLTATTRNAAGSPLTDRQVEWTSDNAAVASVGGSGIVTALSPGSATISARSEDRVATVVLAVIPVPIASVSISPDTATIEVGEVLQLGVVLRDSAGTALADREVVWSTSDESIATVTQNGSVAAVSLGEVTITASSEGVSGTADVTVAPPAVASVAITPSVATLSVGESIELLVTLRDGAGTELSGREVEWVSADPSVATVDQHGTVSGVSPGETTITASSEGVSGTATVVVGHQVSFSYHGDRDGSFSIGGDLSEVSWDRANWSVFFLDREHGSHDIIAHQVNPDLTVDILWFWVEGAVVSPGQYPIGGGVYWSRYDVADRSAEAIYSAESGTVHFREVEDTYVEGSVTFSMFENVFTGALLEIVAGAFNIPVTSDDAVWDTGVRSGPARARDAAQARPATIAAERAPAGEAASGHAARVVEEWFRTSAPEVLAIPRTVFADHDEKTNRLIFGVEHADLIRPVEAILERRGIPSSAYRVEVTEPIYFLEDDLRSEHRPTLGGLQIHWDNSVCTLGFTVSHGAGRSFITNSHCTSAQGHNSGTVYNQPSRASSPDRIAVEADDPVYFTGGVCPSGRRCRSSDAARAVYVDGSTSERGRIAKTTGVNNEDLRIDGFFTITDQDETTTHFPAGTFHKVGRTTGWSSGSLTGTCASVNVSASDITLLCQTRVTANQRIVAGGDSGSPVFSRGSGDTVTLVGILWGGSTDGTTFVFSPLRNVQDELGTMTATDWPWRSRWRR